MYTFTEPNEVKSFKIYDKIEKLEKNYNLWTCEKISKNIKFSDLINIWNNNKILKYKKNNYNLELDYITFGTKFIYNSWDLNLKKNLELTIEEIINIEEDNELDLSLSICNDSSDDESDNEEIENLEIPTITLIVDL